eukprot:365909-Chlamydomonas_euryale.AAC.1
MPCNLAKRLCICYDVFRLAVFSTIGNVNIPACIIAAVGNNGVGVAGVAWGGSVKLLGCYSTDNSSIADDAECLRWCRDQGGAKIVVYPREFQVHSQVFEEELIRFQDEGGLFFSASVDTYPAAYRLPSMVNVGATSLYGNTAFEANYTANLTHLFAPGSSTLSTYRKDEYLLLRGAYPAMAHAAGAAALLWSYRPQLTAQQVKALLLDNVDKQDNLEGLSQSGGVLNVNNAMLAANAASPPPAPLLATSPIGSTQPQPVGNTNSSDSGVDVPVVIGATLGATAAL